MAKKYQSRTSADRAWAVVTGASSGIGYELALLLAAQNYDLVLVSRNRAQMKQLASRVAEEYGARAEVCPQDLSACGASSALFTDLQRKGIAIDVLVNDAGFAMQGPFVDDDPSALVDMLQVNVVALTHLTRLFLPGMIDRGRGRILNIASIGAFMPGPMMAAYFASKAYVVSLSEALANELHNTGVTVTALCPGPTRTRFADRANLTGTKAFRGTLLEASVVAQTGFDAMMRGKTVVIAGLKHRMQLLPLPLVPRRVLAYFARRYHETPTHLPEALANWAEADAPHPAPVRSSL